MKLKEGDPVYFLSYNKGFDNFLYGISISKGCITEVLTFKSHAGVAKQRFILKTLPFSHSVDRVFPQTLEGLELALDKIKEVMRGGR